MVTKIYLVRHGESEGNAQEFFQGNIDTMLTENGKQQLDYLAERFREIPLDAIYFSPYQRARLTAEAVNRHHHLDMIPDYELREINGGEWEGKRVATFPLLYPKEFQTWCEDMPSFCAPNGDEMTEVYERMQKTLTRIAEENAGKTVAVFSHGCALRNFLSCAEFGTIKGLGDVGWSDNTAVSLVEYAPEKGFTLIFKNDSSHLPPELSAAGAAKWVQYEEMLPK